MEDLIGKKLLEERVITDEQLFEALERQKKLGGRTGSNLVALGYITDEELNNFLHRIPSVPRTAEETGMELSFIADLIMKTVVFTGDFRLSDIVEAVKLPLEIVDPAVEILRRDQFVEVKGAAGYAKTTYKFNVTGKGRKRAEELLEICRYIGPAPVTLNEYRNMVSVQTIKHIIVDEGSVKKAFSHLVVSERFLSVLGPAISSGKAIFIYGPPGNGKTTIAETIGQVLPGTVYIPYSIIVRGQIINIFDPVNHLPADNGTSPTTDHRWIAVKRPSIMTGGELTLKMLDLDFNPISKFYEAPLQMKANNGLFIVDDFGRQQMNPHDLLNRWIVPLERRTDFMTLHTGMKFDIPFDQLVIFSTNIEPQKLVDEAFLRRIRYKIRIDHPTEEQYRLIFRQVCETKDIEFKDGVFTYLMDNYYRRLNVRLNACHPRDIIDQIIDDAHYYNHKPELTTEGINMAWNNYFVEM
ncbi:MAG: ATPase [Nitrospirae bacterium]|nr:ATPase [Nitrospirota bacterium]